MSILAVDFGSIHTRVVLIDIVEGVYQLVARAETRTTDSFPINDITVGLDRALRQLSEHTGRTFTTSDGKIITPENEDRAGVNFFTATASLGRPLRAVVIGLMPDISVISAIRSASGTYVDIVETVHLEDGRTEEERVNAILLSNPDLVLLAGGFEKGAKAPVLNLAILAKLAISLIQNERRPTVIYSGNSAIIPQIQSLFDEITSFLPARNVRPAFGHEEITSARVQLADAFDIYKEKRGQGFSDIATMSMTGVMPTAQSYNAIINYLGKRDNQGIIAVDVGSAASIIASSVNKKSNTLIRTDLGLGHNAPALLNTVGTENVKNWIPFIVPEGELQNYAANKTLRPMTIPGSLRDAYIEHALLRSGATHLLDISRPTWDLPENSNFSTIIGAGATLNGLGNPGYTAMLLLDIVQPSGISRIVGDPFGLIAALGAVARVQPEATVQVLDGNNLEPVGVCFSVSGRPEMNKAIMNVTIRHSDGTVTEETLNGGHIWVYHVPIKETVEVEIRVRGRGLSIGGKKRIKQSFKGGTAGLIFDLRGRPIVFGDTPAERAVRMPLWVAEATGYGMQEIDERWLEEINPEIEETPRNKGRRSGLFSRRRNAEKSELPEPNFDDIALDENEEEADDPLRELRDASLS